MRRVGALSLALLTTGCFDYREVAPGPSVATGGLVRVELTDGGTTDVTKALGPYVMVLEGTVQSANDQGLTLGVSSLRRRGEADTRWTGDAITIPRTDIRVLSQRTPSRGKTAVAIGVLSAVVIGLIVAIAKATGLVSGSGPNGQPVPGT
jgi:hypothetical protein